jgi:hypothetical protein
MAISYNSNYDVTIPFSDVSIQIALATATLQTYTIPGTSTAQYSARFSYAQNSNVFVRLNGAAVTPPAGTITTQQYGEFKPGNDGSQRYVKGGDVLQFITPDASAYVGVSLRQLA